MGWVLCVTYGEGGGRQHRAGGGVVAEGTPEEIVKSGKGHTARFLKEVLARRPIKGAKGRRERRRSRGDKPHLQVFLSRQLKFCLLSSTGPNAVAATPPATTC